MAALCTQKSDRRVPPAGVALPFFAPHGVPPAAATHHRLAGTAHLPKKPAISIAAFALIADAFFFLVLAGYVLLMF